MMSVICYGSFHSQGDHAHVYDSCRISLILLAITTALQQPGMAKEPSANPTDEAKAAKRPAKEVAAEMWERIRKVEADPCYKEFSTEYWLSINGKCHDAFRMVDQADDPTVVLEYFVDQFGKHGAEADMRWLLSTVQGTVHFRNLGGESSPRRFEILFKRDMEVCQQIVKRCLKDEAFLKRYYETLLWSNCLLHGRETPSRVSRLVKAANDGHDNEDRFWYWYYARSFVLLAHAFNRDDLLKDADANDLEKRIRSFAEWYEEHKEYMQTDDNGLRWRLDAEAKESGRKHSNARLRRPDSPFLEMDAKRTPSRGIMDYCW